MEEKKIKVLLSNEVYQTLMSDAYSFGFVKADLEPNKNKFINALIVSYYDIYQETLNEIRSLIKKANSNEEVYYKIREILDKTDERNEYSEVLTFKATKESYYYYDLIEENLHDGILSHYFRDMFTSYSRLRQDKREAIINNSLVNKINTAINNSSLLTIYLPEGKKVLRPYRLCKTKEGLFNYLLTMEATNKWIASYKLSNIKEVHINKEKYAFSNEEKLMLDFNVKNGPQFVQSKEALSEVILTPKGEKSFNAIFINRPTLLKKENNHYFFNCSDFQLETYFVRFGKEAYILHPKHVREKVKAFFLDGYNKYQEKK